VAIVPQACTTWLFSIFAVQFLSHMAITQAAKKAIRSSAKKRVFNVRGKRAVHDSVKAAVGTAGKDRKEQSEALAKAYKAIDKATKRGILKKNTAARKKSRLVKKIKAAA